MSTNLLIKHFGVTEKIGRKQQRRWNAKQIKALHPLSISFGLSFSPSLFIFLCNTLSFTNSSMQTIWIFYKWNQEMFDSLERMKKIVVCWAPTMVKKSSKLEHVCTLESIESENAFFCSSDGLSHSKTHTFVHLRPKNNNITGTHYSFASLFLSLKKIFNRDQLS